MRLPATLLFIFIFTASCAQEARRHALASSTVADTAQVSGNPASLAGHVRSIELGATDFYNTGLKKTTLCVVIPFGNNATALDISQAGTGFLKKHELNFSFSKKLGKRFYAGVMAGMSQEKFADAYYPITRNFTSKVGVIVFTSHHLRLGASVTNPAALIAGNKGTPPEIESGLAYSFSHVVRLFIAAAMHSGQAASIRTGIEYMPSPILIIRAGHDTYPSTYCFGTGLNYRSVRIDAGCRLHQDLGIASAVTFGLKF